MKTRKQFLTGLGATIAGAALGNHLDQRASPETPKLEFAFTANITLGTVLEVGNVPHGRRRIINITGGTFEGPAIQGTVEPGGADWQVIRQDQVVEIEAKYTLKTSDGVFIYVTNKGYRHGSQEVLQRLSLGQDVHANEYYFRTSPFMETASAKYEYFNRYIFIASGERKKDSALIHFYKVS